MGRDEIGKRCVTFCPYFGPYVGLKFGPGLWTRIMKVKPRIDVVYRILTMAQVTGGRNIRNFRHEETPNFSKNF